MATSRTKVMLGDAEVADIVSSRKMKGAGPALAKKYGVSVSRVRDIWKTYYGGTTLADAAQGPIKPLPGVAPPAAPLPAPPGSRTAGKFVATAPPTYVKAGTGVKPEGGGTRAKPVRIVAPAKAGAPRGSGAGREMKDLRREMGSLKAGNDSTELASAVQERLWRFAKSGELSPEEYIADEQSVEDAYDDNTQFTEPSTEPEGEDYASDGACSQATETSTSYELSAGVEPGGRADSGTRPQLPPLASERDSGLPVGSGHHGRVHSRVASRARAHFDGSDDRRQAPSRAENERDGGRAEGGPNAPRSQAREAAHGARVRATPDGGRRAAGARGRSAQDYAGGEAEGDYGGRGEACQPAPVRSVYYPIPAAGRCLPAPSQEPLPERLCAQAGARAVRGGPGARGPTGAGRPDGPPVRAEGGRGARVRAGTVAAAASPRDGLYAPDAGLSGPEKVPRAPGLVRGWEEKEERKRAHNGPAWLRNRPA